MKLLLHQFDLPLKHTWTISRGSTDVRRTLIVELQEDGQSGFGEATENDYYGAMIDNISAAIRRVEPILASRKLNDPAELWTELNPELAESTFAQSALDLAAHDLWGKLRGRPVWELWGLDPDKSPPSDYTIGIDSIARMIEKLDEFAGWPVYKVKLGTPDDLEIIRALRAHTEAPLRVDANCAWTAEETIEKSRLLAELGVQFIEQPLPAGDWAGMRRVFGESALPIIADESCRYEADVERCRDHFHGINIKLMKCGGLTPARRMIDRARDLNLKVMVGCMTESTVGISAAAQLLPLLDYADMDGPLLLARDIASGVTFDHGRVIYPDQPGCGVRLL